MYKVKINGKEYVLRVTIGAALKLFKDFNVEESSTWSQADWYTYITKLVWYMIRPRFLFKPFLTFGRFVEKVSLDEVEAAAAVINSVMYGKKGDKESGN